MNPVGWEGMKIAIEGRYDGNLRTRLVHGPSGAEVVTDAPREYRAESELFSATDLVAGALASCMLTYLAILAGREHVDLAGSWVRVEKEMCMEPPRRIGSLTASLHLPAGLGEELRGKLEAAAVSCPVRQSLHTEVAVEVEFVYDVAVPSGPTRSHGL